MVVANPPQGWFPRRGEIYFARLDKLRPVLVISADSLNRHALDVCVVPITTVERRAFTLRVPIRAGDGGRHADSWAKCDQVTTLEKGYLQYPPLGVVSDRALTALEESIKLALGIV